MKWFVFICAGCALFFSGVLTAKQSDVQQTFSMIKPDAVEANKTGHILARIEGEGFRILAIKMLFLTREQASEFYAVHKERPFYSDLVDYMTSGAVIALVIEGDNAVEGYRKLMGPTDPMKAAPGTLRGDFGTSIDKNAVHGSDSISNADKEISFFFSKEEIYNRGK